MDARRGRTNVSPTRYIRGTKEKSPHPARAGSPLQARTTSESRSRFDAALISSTAALNASSLTREGLRYPLTLRTNCSAAASISSSAGGPSALRSVFMLRHTRAAYGPPGGFRFGSVWGS